MIALVANILQQLYLHVACKMMTSLQILKPEKLVMDKVIFKVKVRPFEMWCLQLFVESKQSTFLVWVVLVTKTIAMRFVVQHRIPLCNQSGTFFPSNLVVSRHVCQRPLRAV